MPANYNQYPDTNITKRTRFFDGQFLKDQDFIDDQKYHIDRQRRSQKLLHVPGICEGLEVTSEKKVITVRAGTAIDRKGRMIVLANDQSLNLVDKNGEVYLCLLYREQESDVTQEANALDETDTGSKGATRWWENPEIVAIEDLSKAPTSGLLLARVSLQTNLVDNSVREYSGVRFPSSSPNSPTLRSRSHSDPNTLDLNGSLNISGKANIAGSLNVVGAMTGASNAYEKAQFTLSIAGTASWEGMGGRLKWTGRFIAIGMGTNSTFSTGHVNIYQPSTDIPAAQVYDGKARSANANGIVLNAWESLYAVHTVGSHQSDVTLHIKYYDKSFDTPSNWILIAVVNYDSNCVKLGNGVTLSTRMSSTNGSPIPRGVIMMWSGSVDTIPRDWALCNGQNGTPNLTERFIRGQGNNSTNNYGISTTGGSASCSLTTDHLPRHTHGVNDPGHSHVWSASRQLQGTDDRNYSAELSRGDAGTGDQFDKGTDHRYTGIGIQEAGNNAAFSIIPPYYTLAFIMKL